MDGQRRRPEGFSRELRIIGTLTLTTINPKASVEN